MENDSEAEKHEGAVVEPLLCNTFCSACREIFTGDITRFEHIDWFQHHPNLSEIERAVQENCYICSRIWTSATQEDPGFFNSFPNAPVPKFSIGYQISLESDVRRGFSDAPWNTIRIIISCERVQDGAPNVRHVDNFYAFSCRGMDIFHIS